MIYFLEEMITRDRNLTGGKGAQLAELFQLGLPVPNGFVVDVSEYDTFLVENSLKDLFEEFAGKIRKSHNLLEIKDLSNEMRARFHGGAFSAKFKQQLADAYEKLGGEAVAVRSSATHEDSMQLSFAGQLESHLNIIGMEYLLVAIKKCWSSLWGFRSIMYRLKSNLALTDVSMAVVIQKMVRPISAGVLFTKNPLDRLSNQVWIEATWGLGEALVSSKISPDRWILDDESGRVIEQIIGTKVWEVSPSEEGVITIPICDERSKRPVLDGKQLLELYRIGKKLANYYSYPVDLEWSFDEDQLYLLQARPISMGGRFIHEP
ncbi:PEP/pyruvate-binding domain-containing protein [Pseudoneobacillus sp. C159]